jgi:hypothetical protein
MQTISIMNAIRTASTTLISALAGTLTFTTPAPAAESVSPAEARVIAREGFIYGYPIVDSYRIFYAYFLLPGNPEYKAPLNQLINIARVYTHEDKAIQSPNSDTPYSFVGADLRTEPLVLSVPEIEKERYYSIQLIDAYTHNFAYIGSRATGNGAANYLLAGPAWDGEKPAGITEVIRSETDLVLAGYRTQLFNPSDIDAVIKVQAGYKVQPLSQFAGKPAPAPAPQMDPIRPIKLEGANTPLEIFNVLNFVLKYCPTVPSEQELMKRFAKIGVGADQEFDADGLSPEVQQALRDGIADGWKAYEEFKRTEVDSGKVPSGEMFGTREFLRNNYLYRMAGAILGIYGNSKMEAMYPIITVDSAGEKLDATTARYLMRFEPGKLPPVHAFWSVTMYELPSSLLTENPINRYLINSPMLPGLKRDADGGLTFYIQPESPGKDREANWLPSPRGPFWMAMRLYWPREEALNGTWKAPGVEKAR